MISIFTKPFWEALDSMLHFLANQPTQSVTLEVVGKIAMNVRMHGG
jgi:hypothetical protein